MKLSNGRQAKKGKFFKGKLTPQDTMYRFKFGNCMKAKMDEMVKKWVTEMFKFREIIPALYPFW